MGFASQKHDIALYILKGDVVQANRELLKGLSEGKGCIRYSSLKKVDFDVIRKLLADTLQFETASC